MFSHIFELSIGIRASTLAVVHYLSVILDPLYVLPWIVLCMLLWILLIVTMSCVCENASMSVYPHDCDAMLLEPLGIIDFPNIKLLKKGVKKF